MKKVLTIAGSDSSGGAGVQADLKTMTVHGVFGMSVITAITAQNTLGVTAISDVPLNTIEAQMKAVFSDSFPDAVKIGMVSNAKIIELIARNLREVQAKNIVLDPVMVSTSGSRLIRSDAIIALVRELMPLASIVTPNLFEAEILADMPIKTAKDMEEAARRISQQIGVAVLVKGGHLEESKMDILVHNQEVFRFDGKKIDNANTHGTGCTLSSAIACNLALGMDLPEAVKKAKGYVAGAIEFGMDIGSGRGPLNHMYSQFKK